MTPVPLLFLLPLILSISLSHAAVYPISHPLRPLFPTTTSINAPSVIIPGQLNYFNFTRPEGVREFHLYVPSHYNNVTGHPFSFYFHGYFSDYQQGLGFNMTGDAEEFGYLFAFPQGTISPTTGARGWNAGVCCLFLNSTSQYVDDVEFAREALHIIEQAVHVNARRRSNGGYMSERLACETGPLFAGVAADASAVGIGVGGETGLATCDREFGRGGGAPSILLFHGTADPVVPWTGFNSSGWLPNTPSTLLDTARWVTRMGCGKQITATYNDGTFSNLVWERCQEGTEFELMTVRGGVHAWWTTLPGSLNFSTTRYVMHFFERTAVKQREARGVRLVGAEMDAQ